MTWTATLEEQATALERDALALRKIIEAAEDLGEDRIRALLDVTVNGNGHTNGNGNGHVVPGPFVPGAGATPPVEEPEASDEPRGREAVRRIVTTRYGIWTLAQLREEMKRRGWFTSNKGTEVAVTRMCKSNEARRVGKGRYEFFDPEDRRLL
jgi:hypothetical protein